VTRRDFEFIARVLATAPVDNDTVGLLADHFTRALAERETSFDRTHFLSTLLEAMTEE
jgi:hypothetical protein